METRVTCKGCISQDMAAELGVEELSPTLRHAVDYWAAREPDKTAYVDAARERTYAQMAAYVEAMQKALVSAGVRRQDRIVTALPAGMTFAALLFSAMRIGANLIPFDLLLSEADVRRRLDIVKPRIVFASQTSHLQQAVDMGYPTIAVGMSCEGCEPLADFLAEAEDTALDGFQEAPQDEAVLTIFTSGSTGNPKGVLLSEAALIHANSCIKETVDATYDDVLLTALPMSHIYGVNAGILLPMLVGATSVLVAKFKPEAMLDAVVQHKVSVFNGVPSMYQRMANEQEQNPRDISSLCRGSIAGAKCDNLERYHEMLHCSPRICYGLTESPLLASTRDDDSLNEEETGVGRFFDSVEGIIVDEKGNPVARGEHGEIVCKSPGVMLGYLNPEDADRSCVDADGWIHTDDIGYLDERGYVHVVGRKSAVINRGGYKVYPPEIEALYNTNPAVLDCCALGFEHVQLGQQIVLFVELRHAGVDAHELREFAKGKVAKYKIPDQVIILDKMPQLPNGKHDKTALRRIFDQDETVFHSDEERLAKS